MKLQKNKKKEKAIVQSVPKVEAEVVSQEPNPVKDMVNAARRINAPQPCVVFKEGFHIPNLEEQKVMQEMMVPPKMAVATGYQEDGSINISVVEQSTFPDFMLKYSMQHGSEECLNLLKDAGDTVAATAVNATRSVIFSSLTAKINHVVLTAMSQAKKVIVDELEKYSPELRNQVLNALNNDHMSKYGINQPIYTGDVSVNANGGLHSLGNIIANCKPCDENVDAVKKSLSMWLDNYMIAEYDSTMQIIMQKVYSSNLDITQADEVYAVIEEFASDVFKCYGTPIHNSLDDFAQDVIFAQMCAYPNARLRGYRYCSDEFDD